MYSIVKGISYSTINSSLSTSSLCEDWPRRTTASNESQGPGDRMKHKHTNLPETLWLPVYYRVQLWRATHKKTCEIMQPFKRIQKKTSTELLLGIYLTKLNEEERWRRRKSRASSVPGLGRGKRPPPTPSPSLPPTCCRGRSECDWPSSPSGTSGFFSQYSDPLHHPPPHSRPPFLSHGALVFNWPSV